MPNFYEYLISSLPMLHFAARPPFSFERFLEICRDSIPEEDSNIITQINTDEKRQISTDGNLRSSVVFNLCPSVLKKWFEFDRLLKNELVKIRASRKHLDPAKYIRGEEYSEQFIVHAATSAHRTPSILEAEKVLDQARWQFLDELQVGHFFDLDFIIIYALKLLILERWQRINSVDKVSILEEVLK